ncbi:MAG: ATP-binding protein [Tissierellaceae bacterium]
MNSDIISLDVPSKPDYISLIRLTTSGIAHNMGLNIEEIEDVKVCVAEACVNVLNFNKKVDKISIIYEVKEDNLTIKVRDVLEDISDKSDKPEEGELGLLIIKSLMDKVIFTIDGIEMTKYIE